MFHGNVDMVKAPVEESLNVKALFFHLNADLVLRVAETIADAVGNGKKILLFGNGGSAADAQHISAEFMGRFSLERDPIPALALTTDTSLLTAISNDYGFDQVFARQIIALGQPNDVAIAISTSGNSRNVLMGIEAAKSKRMWVVGMSGADGGKMGPAVDVMLGVPSTSTPRIQETHILIGHVLCEIVENLTRRFRT